MNPFLHEIEHFQVQKVPLNVHTLNYQREFYFSENILKSLTESGSDGDKSDEDEEEEEDGDDDEGDDGDDDDDEEIPEGE